MLFIPGKTDCAPADVDYNSERLEVLNNHFRRLIDEKEIQCVTYSLSRGGKVFAGGAIGKKSFRENDDSPALPDSIRGIASVTKLFTAVAIMKLVEDGIVRLDDLVADILPQFATPPYDKINLFHLLTHTSGMHSDPNCFPNKYQKSYWSLIDNAYKQHDPKKDGEFDWITAALGTIGSGVRTEPGTEWAYNTFGFALLGAIIERLTGLHAHKYIEEKIAKPLKLKDTMFKIMPKTIERHIITDEYTEKFLQDFKAGTIKKDPLWDMIPSTGGGLHSTAYDMNRFGNMLINDGTVDGVRIIGRKAVEKMTSRALHNIPDKCWGADKPDRGYGIGFDMRDGLEFTFSPGTFCHEGAGRCALYIDPKEKLVAAWIVPYVVNEWRPKPLFNAINIMWSGLL